ncbi:CLUMA_CG001215, isoform A [Clunio marinus]|uniref:CLUMA_CG001215, isoform A n=1 Tax=Clunio marinus TaxID=568069 RepID=A0A1J1HHD3_9DIPT|nr:CLUMA_CG001215, isoform A [Clunio marinus]
MKVADQRMNLKTIIFIFLLTQPSSQAEKEKTKSFVEKIELTQNTSILEVKYFINETENGSYSLSYNFTVFVKVQNLFLQNSVNVLSANGKYEPFMGKGVTNLCKFWSNRKGNKLIRMLFDKIKGYRNLPKSCPIEPGFYYTKDVIFDGKNLAAQNIWDVKFMIALDYGTKTNGKMLFFLKLKRSLEFGTRKGKAQKKAVTKI